MNLIPIDESVSTDSEIYSIVSWSDYTSGEEDNQKDYKIINEFTNKEFENIYQVNDKYNKFGEILDDLGYGLMNLVINSDPCNHEIQYFTGPEHIPCSHCCRYLHKKNRAHCSLCYKNFCRICLKTNYEINFPEQKEEKAMDNLTSSRISNLENRLNMLESTVNFLNENYQNFLNKESSKINEKTLMAKQQECIPLICNKNKIRSIRILVKITFPKINSLIRIPPG